MRTRKRIWLQHAQVQLHILSMTFVLLALAFRVNEFQSKSIQCLVSWMREWNEPIFGIDRLLYWEKMRRGVDFISRRFNYNTVIQSYSWSKKICWLLLVSFHRLTYEFCSGWHNWGKFCLVRDVPVPFETEATSFQKCEVTWNETQLQPLLSIAAHTGGGVKTKFYLSAVHTHTPCTHTSTPSTRRM